MNKSEIIDKILKVKALAERGASGERDNATKLLQSLMKKYGITESDLYSDEKDLYFINTCGNTQLFVQVYMSMYKGEDRWVKDIRKMPKKDRNEYAGYGWGDKDADSAIKCTKSEFLEVKALFSVYKEDFDRQLEVFKYAYFRKNDLLGEPKPDEPEREHTEEEVRNIINAIRMSEGIEKKEVHKMIENE